MLSFLSRHAPRLLPAADLPPEGPEDGVVWLDLKEPDPDEIRLVEQRLGIEMPTREEMREIEASSRVYEEGDALYLTATLLVNAETAEPGTTEVTFILKGGRLVTLRYAEPQPFRTLHHRLDRHGAVIGSGQAALFWLLDAIIARLADVLERVASDVDGLSGRIFAAARSGPVTERPDLLDAMGRIGRDGEMVSRVRESLLTLTRILFAIGQQPALPSSVRKDVRNRAKILSRDCQSLAGHAEFVSHKVNFLLDATLGLISIEQNAIIKIFSVVAVVFLPPTLIASIYGMNFDLMPELHWKLGYPLAVLMMIVSAVLPYLYFKRRGWL